MQLAKGASVVGTSTITIDSDVSDAVEMRLSPPMRQISSADSHAIGIATDGTLWAWGRNQFYQAGGDGVGTLSPTAMLVSRDTTWKLISAGGTFNIGIQQDGSLWAWSGGQGTGLLTSRAVPTMVTTETAWKDVAAGSWHSVAVKNDGTLWSTGYNNDGQLGDGTKVSNSVFTRVGTASDWEKVWASSRQSWAIKSDGSLWAWGKNDLRQLGIEGVSSVTVPTRVGTATDWESVSTGFGIKKDGTLWGWGPNYSYAGYAPVPSQVGTATDWVEVSGGQSTMARKADGSLWTWGWNDSGGCGVGYASTVATPTRLGTDTGWTDVCSGDYSTFALKDGDLYDAGSNYYAQLGTGDTTSRLTLTRIGFWEPYSASRIWRFLPEYNAGKAGVSVLYRDGVGASLALTDTIQYDLATPSGNLYINPPASKTNTTTVLLTSTVNDADQMRVNSGSWIPYTSSLTTVAITTGDGLKTVTVDYRNTVNGNTASRTAKIILDTVAPAGPFLLNGGEAVTRFNRVAMTTEDDDAVMMKLEGAPWTSVAAGDGVSIGVRSDGTMWGWGNRYAAGAGLLTSEVGPKRIGADSDWASVTARGPIFARKTDGSLWTWGDNTYGQLGDDTRVTKSVPQRIGSSRWASVAAGNTHGSGVKTDGTLWTWGDGYMISGQPSQLGTAADWRSVFAGYQTTYALKSDGSLWAWGTNYAGQFGDGLTNSVATALPKRIGTATDWRMLAPGNGYVVALKNDGSLWAWGQNAFGTYGDGTTTSVYVPKRIGTETDWSAVSGGALHTVAVKNDGSVWTWGQNANGELGDGTTVASATPKKIVAGSTTMVAAGYTHSLALASNGAITAWGDNSYGQVGDGTSTRRLAPAESGWLPFTKNYIVDLTSGSGDRSVTMTYRDALGQTATHTDSITVDPLATAGTLELADGSEFTSQTTVAVRSTVPGARQMRVGTRWAAVGVSATDVCAKVQDASVLHSSATGAYEVLGQALPSESGWKFNTGTPYSTPEYRSLSYSVDHSLAVKHDGTLWVWGSNGRGQLGGGWNSTMILNVPGARVDGGQWRYAVAGDYYSAGIRSDGSLWMWGANTYGQLGIGNTTDSNVPVRVGTSNDWDLICAGPTSVIATKNDGSLWTWGNNASRQLMLGDTTNRTVPTQVAVASLMPYAAETSTSLSWMRGSSDVFGAYLDDAGNVSWVSDHLAVDQDPPSTTIWGIPGSWTTAPVTFGFNSNDGASGVAATYYRVNGGEPRLYGAPVTVTAEGYTYLDYWSVDRVGFTESTKHAVIKRDSVATGSISDAGTCTGCHTTYPAAHPMDDCNACHIMPMNPVQDCRKCHKVTQSHGPELFLGAGSPYSHGSLAPYTCEWCHANTIYNFTTVPKHPEIDLVHVSDRDTTGCYPCHSGNLTREHSRYKDSGGAAFTCATCHGASARTGVPEAITAGDSRCEACHDAHPHTASQFTADSSRTACAKCHSTDLVLEHAKATSSSAAAGCQACHAAGGQRSSFGAWDRTCQTGACHGGESAPDPHGFSVAPVNYATACRKCHDQSLAGTHPYHNAEANCGASCHPGWGASSGASIPRYLDTYGVFATSSSQEASAASLHLIHSKATWPARVDTSVSKCGSCHAVVACAACHDGTVSSAHATHASTMTSATAWTGPTSRGVDDGDQLQDSHVTTETVRCGGPLCHATDDVSDASPWFLEDRSHAASTTYRYLANTVVTTGTWRSRSSQSYTAGQQKQSNTTGSTLSVGFTGRQIAILADNDPYRGIAEVLIDGVSQGEVDLYSDITRNQVEVFRSGVLAPGSHTITVKVKGTKSVNARATNVTVDRFDVYEKPAGSVAPVCAGCH